MIHSNRGFPEDMSSNIAIVLRSYDSHVIFLNQSKTSHFHITIVEFFSETLTHAYIT